MCFVHDKRKFGSQRKIALAHLADLVLAAADESALDHPERFLPENLFIPRGIWRRGPTGAVDSGQKGGRLTW